MEDVMNTPDYFAFRYTEMLKQLEVPHHVCTFRWSSTLTMEVIVTTPDHFTKFIMHDGSRRVLVIRHRLQPEGKSYVSYNHNFLNSDYTESLAVEVGRANDRVKVYTFQFPYEYVRNDGTRPSQVDDDEGTEKPNEDAK